MKSKYLRQETIPIDPKRLFYILPFVAIVFSQFANDYILYVANLILVYMAVSIGFNIVLGNLGQLAFANAAFFGIGAYATGLLMAKLGLSFTFSIIGGALAGGVVGFLSSVAALRGIRMYYLAILTLAFGELLRWLYIHADSVTEGSSGFSVPVLTIFSYRFDTEAERFILFVVIITILSKVTANLLRSKVGRAILSIKDNELITASLGISSNRYIIFAFIWSGMVVAIGGGMFAVVVGRVSPESFNLLEIIMHFAMVMVGGIGSLAGSMIGAIIITIAPEIFRNFPGLQEIFLASLIIVTLLFLPKGIVSLLEKILPIFRERYYRE